MSKKWYSVNEIIDNGKDLPRDLYEYDTIMKEKPNFNHEKDCSEKIYEYKNYIILKVRSKNKIGYIIHNTNLPFKKAHTHLNSYKMAKTIVDNVIKKRRPKTTNLYLLSSHARVSDDDKYIKLINELIEAKKSKGKQIYRNRSK